MNTPFRLVTLEALLSCAVVCAVGLAATPTHAALDERIARIESGLAPRLFVEGQPVKWTLQDRMAHYRVPGVSIAVINDGKIEWARGYGTLEAGGSEPVNADTVFQAASISKPVSALALLRLAEAGSIKLDQDVNELLKTWKVPASDLSADQKVTLRRMLSHSSGLTVHGFRGYAAGEAVPTIVQILDGEAPSNSGAIRVDIKPGTRERYSGGGYVVMHQLIRDITGKSFETVLQSSVLDPLGMTRSTFEQPLSAAWATNAARAHRGDGKTIAGQWHTYPELAPDGLWTTPTDLARFAIELQQSLRGESNKVISAAMTQQMLTRQLQSMGLGIVVVGAATLRFEHGGSNEGYRCHLVAYASGRGCVVMTNSNNGGALVAEIQRAIANEYEWADYRPMARKLVPVDPDVLAGYAGSYQLPNAGRTAKVRVDQNTLIAEVEGTRVNLIAETPQRFRIIDDETLVTFFTVGGRKALWGQNRFWPMVAAAKTDGSSQPQATSGNRPAGSFLVFRDTPSWRRPTDFEHVLRALGHEVELKASSAMADSDLSRYAAIIVPGAQPRDRFYPDYIRQAARFDEYVANGGTLILELNGAEGTSIILPGGVTMTPSAGRENTIVRASHPIFAPFGNERVIRANLASHGYLSGVPSEAFVLVVESNGTEMFKDRPTFIEYKHGKGRVIAACQCFHDQDNSGRGPLMATVLDYVAAKSWVREN